MATSFFPLKDDVKKGEKRLANFLVLLPIVEHPEQEDQAVADDQATATISQVVMATSSEVARGEHQQIPSTCLDVFSETSFEDSRLWDLLIKEWAKAAKIQGKDDHIDRFPTKSYEQQRWD